MPPTRSHDPFNDAPRRPTSRTQTHHETQPTDNDPTRRNNLFASSLSRRPPPSNPSLNPRSQTTTTSPVHEDDSADDSLAHIGAPSTRPTQPARPTTRTRARRKIIPAPNTSTNNLNIYSPTPPSPPTTTTPDIVVRAHDKDAYIQPIPELGEQIHGNAAGQAAEDQRLGSAVGEYWSRQGGSGTLLLSGRTRLGAGGEGSELGLGRLSEREAEGWSKLGVDVMARLREAVGEKLGEERWLFERTDVMEALSVANHGRM